METLTKLLAACATAGFSRADADALLNAITRQAVRALLCKFEETGEPFWLIERPGAWPPQNCYLADWPRLRFGVEPNPNICGKCGHDSSQLVAGCACVCHDIYAGILGYPEAPHV